MCGILGGSKKNWKYQEALESISYRGPDGMRIKELNGFTLGFVRLAIMDLSENGMQPMPSSDQNVWITYNGEIYGYQNLKKKLEKKGYKFNSTSDTEVILNAYLEYGDKFVEYIDGIFAIVIYDFRIKKLKLYRDRVGVKPIYYYYDGKEFAFASELKELVTLCNDVNFEIDYTAIYDYLTYTYIPEPKTMYKKIHKLPPACAMIYDFESKKIVKKIKYWSLKVNVFQEKKEKKSEIYENIRTLVSEAVKEQMVADVPVGSFLSGGIDSSIVTYECMKINPNIETFSIGFTEKKYDELKYADMLSEKYSITKNQQIVNKNLFQSLYYKLKDWYDEPYSDASAFPTYLVSKLARQKVTVVLTGDGGDELFGGYNRYSGFIKMEIGNNRKKSFSSLYENLLRPFLYEGMREEKDKKFLEDVARCCFLYEYMIKSEKKKFSKEWHINRDYDDYWYFRKYYNKELPPITRMQYMDFYTYLPSDILTKVDRASMQNSLEARVPLLNKKLIEYAFSLSEEERCPKGALKGALKSAYEGIIPDEILYRRKMGFGIPGNYLKHDVSQQEEFLRDIWKITLK